MKHLRILLLVPESQVPPASLEELGEELDSTWAHYEIAATLEELGHEVHALGVADELSPIRLAIEEFRPHVVFNQILEFHGAAFYDAHVVSYLELLKTPYTGCNPRGMLLSSDKALAKKIMVYHHVRVPRFASVPRGRKARLPHGAEFPLFVKSVVEHASLGISQASIVTSAEALEKRVAFVHESVGTDALIEEYIDGRELTIGVIGNQRLTTLPIWEMTFANLPQGTAPIATSRVKWNPSYQKKVGLHTGPAEISDAQRKDIERTAKRVYKRLGMSGFARIDLRMDREGRIYVLEANPNPDLTAGEDFAESAEGIGLDYSALLQRIVALGLRYRAAWKDA
jgi:D-alanine-D-alanine ligase